MQALLFGHLGKLTLSSSLSGGAFSWPKIVGGEDILLKLRFAEDQDGQTVEVTRTVQAIKASIGRQQIAPEDGTFTLKLGADPETAGENTTAKLPWNISAADLAAALDALTDSALAACKPFYVSARDGSFFIAAKDRSAITWSCVDNELWPSSKVHIQSRDFDEGLGYELRLNQAPVAQVTTFNSLVPAIPTMEQIRAGATNSGVLTTELQRLFVPVENPAGFSFCLTRGYRKTAPIVIGSNDNAESLSALLNAKADAATGESGFVDEGEAFKVYAAPNGAIIEFTGDLAGVNQDLLGISIIAEAEPDTVVKLSTKTPSMATLLRKVSSTTKEIAAVLHLTVWLVNEQDEEAFDEYNFHVPITLVAPVNMDDLIAAVDVNWATPLSRESYLQHSPTQIATGQRHYLIDTAIGDDVATEFTITHDLGTRFLLVQLQEADAAGQFLHLGTDYEVEIVSDNAIKLIFAVAPDADSVIGQITSAAHDANFEPHTHSIDEIDGLEDRLSGIEETLAELQASAAVQSGGSRDPAAGSVIMKQTLPVFADAYPMKTSLLAAVQSAQSSQLANATATQVTSGSTTTTTTTGTVASVAAINRIADIPVSALPKDGDLLGAIHDASLTAQTSATLPTPGTGNKGTVWQYRAATTLTIPGGGGRKSSPLKVGQFFGSDGRRLYRLINPTCDEARVFTAATSDVVTLAQHGYSDTQRVRVFSTGTLPAGLSADTDYYVINAAGNTFKLSTSSGGSAVDITDTGTGTHYLHTAPLKTSYYPADFERELFVTPVDSDAMQVKKTAEWKFGFETAILNKKTQSPRISDKITRGQWRLLIEIGTALAEDAPATADSNIKRIVWGATPVLDKTICVTNDTPAVLTFGARVKRTAAPLEAASFTVEKCIYGNWTASSATLATADFFLRARLTQFDVEDIDDAEGFVVVLGLDKVITGDAGDMGTLIIK